MVVEIPSEATDKTFSSLLRAGDKSFRSAIAAQMKGEPSGEYWDQWVDCMAAILLASWASGALASTRPYGVPLAAINASKPTFARYLDTLRFTPPPDKEIKEVTMQFQGESAKEVVERFIRLIPMTRAKWESLIEKAFESAQEIKNDESAKALDGIIQRSPNLAELITGKARRRVEIVDPNLPEAVRIRRTQSVQDVAQGSFFVTGMTQSQIRETKDILAKVVSQEVSVSVAGKKLDSLGIGDFVEQTVLETATNLTAARLETIYRTNVNRAQSQGRLDICRDDLVKKFIPLLRFRATKDKRTRDSHRMMDGYIATVEQIDSMGIATPIGFNCRCSWSPISIAKAVRDRLCNEDGIPDFAHIRSLNGSRQKLIDTGLVPDVGFISG